jgi:hypothetical protein
MANNFTEGQRRLLTGAGALVLLAGALGLLIWLWIEVTDTPGASTLPLLLLVSILLILIVFGVVAMLYSAVGLSDKNQALGLPQGSVRALLAFGLVILFTIISLSFFSQLGSTQVIEVTQTQYESLDADQITSGVFNDETKMWTVHIRSASRAQVDLAQQIVAALITLVAAVAAFYFGSKSTDDRTLERLLAAMPSSTGGDVGPALSDLSLKTEQVDQLRVAGITSVVELAVAEPADVAAALGVTEAEVEPLITEAKELLRA